MDKPSDYGSDIRGSNPLGGTSFYRIPKINPNASQLINERY